MARASVALAASTPGTALDIINAIRSGKKTAEEAVRESLEQIRKQDDRIEAFLSVNGEQAIQDAKALDRRLASQDQGEGRGTCLDPYKQLPRWTT